uniref:Uncharacterized protein n=1 Tax=Rhizophora mucronata TaxID=61149 RepID=A0A2P2IZ83_RHIMU
MNHKKVRLYELFLPFIRIFSTTYFYNKNSANQRETKTFRDKTQSLS